MAARQSLDKRLVLLILTVGAASLQAEVKEVRSYRTHEPRDHLVRFAMAVAPNGDAISFVAKKDGKWRLTRSSFSVQTTIHQAGLLDYFTDRAGRLVAQEVTYLSQTPVAPKYGARAVTLKFFTLPDLGTDRTCRFAESQGALRDQDCGPSLTALLDGLRDGGGATRNNPGNRTSRDGKFRAVHLDNLHRNWLDQYVTTELKDDITSVETGAQVGVVNETTRDSVNVGFASLNARDYFLVIEGGTQLKVYQITEPHP